MTRTLRLQATQHSLAFSTIKLLMQHANYTPQSREELKAFSLLDPHTQDSHDIRHSGSLTDATQLEHQIRFALRDRVDRRMHQLAKPLSTALHTVDMVIVSQAEHIDAGSQAFFRILALYLPPTKIQLQYGGTSGNVFQYHATPHERVIESVMHRTSISEPDAELLLAEAQTRIHHWDYWSALSILRVLYKQQCSPLTQRLLALCLTFFEDTAEAHFHYECVVHSDDFLQSIHAAYALAMLHIRHHTHATLSIENAAHHLDDAYARLMKHPDTSDYMQFLRVFNRNGYALVAFRRGNIDQAIELLDSGIATLRSFENADYELHRSVLIYNRAQCYHQLNDRNETHQAYTELLRLDPEFPEYAMEFAKCCIAWGAHSEATELLHRARRLDATIPETYALLGFLALEQGQLPCAERHYKEAWRLAPWNHEHCYNYVYALAQGNHIRMALTILSQCAYHTATTTMQENIALLHADLILQSSGDCSSAFAILHDTSLRIPDSAMLQDNIHRLTQLAVNKSPRAYARGFIHCSHTCGVEGEAPAAFAAGGGDASPSK